MNKPFSMICEEFKQGLADLINNANLPPLVVELILQNHLNEVSNFVRSQYQYDKAQYEKSLSEDKIENRQGD